MPNGGRPDSIGDDFTDLDSIWEQDGRYTPGSTTTNINSHNYNSSNNNGYRISFQSVDDEELKRLMRALVTPVPNQHGASPSIDDYRNKQQQRQYYYDDTASDSSSVRINNDNNNNRSESVTLFKKINDGMVK